jgi:PIN domain nuclease of toxin-antitoxin system
LRALLDTHAFLWWIGDDPRLSKTAREVLLDEDNEVYFSTASAWEIAIKARLGRIELPRNVESFISKQLDVNDFTVLPIQLSHALRVAKLPAHHEDPFDRILIAQAQIEKLTLVSADKAVARYSVEVAW